MKRLRVVVSGRVQGVCFRAFSRDKAREYGLSGWVRNLPDRSVELEVEGPDDILEQFLSHINRGPYFARVDNMVVESLDVLDEPDFSIRY